MAPLKYLFLICAVWVSASSWGVRYSMPGVDISPLMYWVEPEGEAYSVKEVLEEASWSKIEGELNFGYSYRHIWVMQKIHTFRKGDWVMEIPYPLLDYVDLYLFKNGELTATVNTGDRRPFSNREVKVADYVYGVSSEGEEDFLVLLRLETEGTMMMPIVWRSEVEFAEHLAVTQAIYGAFYGIIIVMALYHFFIFIVVRERSYLYYCITVSAFVFLQLNFDGRGFGWLWPETPEINQYGFPLSYNLYQMAVLTFISTFLQLKKNHILLYRYFVGLRILVAINLVAMFIFSYATMMPIIVMVGMLGIVSGLVSGAYLWLRGYTAARYFTSAWAMFLIGILLLNLRGFGLGETNWFSQYGYLMGSVLEVLLLAFSLADRINVANREKRKTEKALLASQNERLTILNRYQELYENAPVGNFQTDNQYQLVSVNQACAQLFGYAEPDEMLANVKDIRVYLRSGFDEFQSMVRKARKLGRVNDQEIHIEDQAGERRWLSISMRYTKNDMEEGYEGSVQDITERKVADELRQELDRERIQIMEQFSLGIAKEINTPLGSNVVTTAFIREGLDHILEKQGSKEATAEDYQSFLNTGSQSLGLIESNQKRITRVVRRFREVSSQHLGLKKSHFNLQDLINETVESQRWKMAGWRVHVVCPMEMTMYSYPKAVAVILKQLIDNALTHSYADQDQDPKIWIRVESQVNDELILTFTDNGKGVQKEMAKNLCKPFFSTKRGPEGHIGLGLYMVYNLVSRSLNGRLFFPVTGSGFCIQLSMPQDISAHT